MKILQDNKQKLNQTRQEIIEKMRQERFRKSVEEPSSTFQETASIA